MASGFASYVARNADTHGLPLAEYKGAAVEWFLWVVENPSRTEKQPSEQRRQCRS